MEDWLSFFVGIIVLILGVPIGNLLAKYTREELARGKVWLRRLIVLSFLGALISLAFQHDVLLFTFLFIAIVTSRSLKRKAK